MNLTSLFLAVGFTGTLALSSARAEVDFVTQVAPVLEKHCVECHGADLRKGRLRLDNRADAFRSEGVLVAGKADDSEFFKRIILPAGDDDLMPAEKDPLPKAVQDILRDWINEGAKWPEGFVIAGKELAPRKEIAWPPEHQATEAEKQAIQKLNGLGIAVRPIALNSNWLTANLRVFSGELNDDVIGALGQITGLVDLNLASTAIDDARLAKLAGLKNLMTLRLENTKITDAGLRHLAGMAYLNYLNVYGTAVTDAGLDALKDLKRLEKLYVWQTQVTAAGVARLKAAIPAVDVNTGASLIVVEEKKEEEKK